MQSGSEHPNAVIVRRGLEAFNRGDMQAYDETVADDVVWHQIGVAEPLRGKRALGEAMSEAMAGGDTPWQITAELHDVVANDDHAIALVNATATKDGQSFQYRTAEILHIRDGKVAERWAFSDDTQRIAEFFA